MMSNTDHQSSKKSKSLSFLLRPPIQDGEVKAIESKVRGIIETTWSVYNSGGTNALLDHVEQNQTRKGQTTEEAEENDDNFIHGDASSKLDYMNDAKIEGDPRRYQVELFQRAKTRNTIVSLGTGQGKTLIAMMTIRHFQSTTTTVANTGGADSLPKQIWFLVPSVALAIQQSQTLQSNLPYTVAVACHTAACSAKAREELSKAQILVATHGSALDLMRHYADSFNLSRVNLLVLDECHHAMKKHNYAVLMKTFYHVLPRGCRPHVLGLSASPIINVPKNITNDKLEGLLSELEETLDANLVSLSTLGLSKEESGVILNNVQECVVKYENDANGNSTTTWNDFPSPPAVGGIHKSRHRELDQLKYLCFEFGPIVVRSYVSVLLREISRNRFEKETVEQHERFRDYLKVVLAFCEEHSKGSTSTTTSIGTRQGKTDKLLQLEKLLFNIFQSSTKTNDNTVGLLFVERRITALALKQYFTDFSLIQEHEQEMQANSDASNDSSLIKCDLLTRHTSHVFKYLSPSHKLSQLEQQEAYDDWLHKMRDAKEVLDKLRQRKINLLICTSVVEEGVDVDACSFVIVLDDLKTTKGYIQMKGRARQLHANFYVFENSHLFAPTAPVSLADARQVETHITEFIGVRKQAKTSRDHYPVPSPVQDELSSRTFCEEEKALMEGEYRAVNGMVDLSSSKSLVNRYSCCIPMDINSRSSRDAMRPYLPLYTPTSLYLPSHLPEDVRVVTLPDRYITTSTTTSKKQSESMLALMACVRLYKLHLLNDRLLPIRGDDIKRKLMKSALVRLKPVPQNTEPLLSILPGETKTVYVYPLIQSGVRFEQNNSILCGGNRKLCIISLKKLQITDLSLDVHHNDLGPVHCKFGTVTEVEMTSEEWSTCIEFFTTVINARWRRRTGHLHFRYNPTMISSKSPNVQPHIVAYLNEQNILDFDRMAQTNEDYKRSEGARQLAVMQWDPKHPRLWAPMYDPNNTYISFYQEGDLVASSPFPDSSFNTFEDYFLEKRSVKLSPDCPMFSTQRLWHLPGKSMDIQVEGQANIPKKKDSTKCHGLSETFLPRDACMEAPLPDASLYLHLLLLPQILYDVNRLETTNSFIQHCSIHFPCLGEAVQSIKNTDVLSALTAKSCALSYSYDRLEYLGDAVLKLLQTDALIHSSDEELRRWIMCLHEGDLTSLRSAMGCNERLHDVARCAGLDSFILTRPLGRGTWVPHGLEAYIVHDNQPPIVAQIANFEPSMKAQADVVEALLGLIYLKCGYEKAVDVAVEIGASLPKEEICGTTHADEKHSIAPELVYDACAFLNMKEINKKELLLEALTHPSQIHSKVPSYQRLEWIGDAVLCLAAREWVYNTYPKLSVKHLVQIETIIICNESLCLLGFASKIHKHIHHCNSTLPSRLEKYETHTNQMNQGLWGTDPPKVVADVVEALLGVAHFDGSFKQGQKSAIYVVRDITSAILSKGIEMDQMSEQLHVDEQRHALITHPKQSMLESCEVLSVRSYACHEYQRKTSSMQIVWTGKSWNECNKRHEDEVIAEVTWCGMRILTVAGESSHTVAKNRACALISSLLRQSPELKTYLLDLSNQTKKRKR